MAQTIGVYDGECYTPMKKYRYVISKNGVDAYLIQIIEKKSNFLKIRLFDFINRDMATELMNDVRQFLDPAITEKPSYTEYEIKKLDPIACVHEMWILKDVKILTVDFAPTDDLVIDLDLEFRELKVEF